MVKGNYSVISGTFISVGAIGVAGVAHLPAIESGGFEFADARKWVTQEALAAIEGAKAAGVEKIVVADAHPTGLGILLDDLPKDVRVVRSWPRPLGAMEGVGSDDITHCVLLGQHSAGQNWSGLLSRTLKSDCIRDLRVDGRSVGELELNNLIASAFGVRLAFVAGDQASVEEALSIDASIETVTTKYAISYSSVQTRPPHAVLSDISRGVEKALERRDRSKVEKPTPSIYEVEFIDRPQVELLALLPMLKRTGPFTLALPSGSVLDAMHWLTVFTHYQPGGVRLYN